MIPLLKVHYRHHALISPSSSALKKTNNNRQTELCPLRSEASWMRFLIPHLGQSKLMPHGNEYAGDSDGSVSMGTVDSL